MTDQTHIEWTDHTYNPWIGCTKVSAACDHCYAEAQNGFRRWNRQGWGAHADRHRVSEATLRKPLAWNRAAQKAGHRRRVFCASLADVFDNHRSIHPEWRRDLWQMIEDTPHLDWQLLTKRPQNFAKLAPARWIHDGCPANLWIGTTVENQTEANRRIPHLLEIPSRVRFLSCEPLLGPVDLTSIDTGSGWVDALQSYIKYPTITPGVFRHEPIDWPSLDWVIAGGESGPQARPTNPQWLRDLRDQCAGADVPFLFKQWGEWVSVSEVEGPGVHHKFDDGRTVRRTGKKRAGRLLDGVLHDAFPTEIET